MSYVSVKTNIIFDMKTLNISSDRLLIFSTNKWGAGRTLRTPVMVSWPLNERSRSDETVDIIPPFVPIIL